MKSSTSSGTSAQPTTALRTWGFRLSVIDCVVLVILATITAVLHRLDTSLWWLVAIVAIHFFLFCNVFRVLRIREFVWAGIFVLNVGFWFLLGRLDWFNVMACQLPVSAGVVSWEIRATRYHGIFADRLNPVLNDYLEGKIP
jgi:hypothetical protein